jgi:hypothetical protein
MSMHGDAGDAVASDSSRTDALIDTAARSMTRGEPPPRLRLAIRARVVSKAEGRIDKRRAWPGRRSFAGGGWFAPVWVPALGAAVAIVLALVVGRAWLGSPDGPDKVHPTNASRAQEAVVIPATPVPVEKPLPQIARIDQSARPRVRRPTVPKLPVVEPLVIEPLQIRRLAADTDSGVMPIDIDPLRIEPLQPQ